MAATTRKPKLHELLGVRRNLEAQAGTTTNGLALLFEKKSHHFTGRTVAFLSNAEGAEPKVETQVDIQTTVKSELEWLTPHVARWIDAMLQIAIANQTANADIELDGHALAKDIPSSHLLELEKVIEGMRALVLKIPTLEPLKGFHPDPDKGEGVSVARLVEKQRTLKGKTVITLAPPTDKHAAQVQLIDEDKPVGTIREQEWSSLITPAHKSEILGRVENLQRAIKTARMRANDAEVDTNRKIGDALLRYVFFG